jgi:septal ring factor EnvC (AmiA/AmiB activator)
MFKEIADESKQERAQKRKQLASLESTIVDKSLPAFGAATFAQLDAAPEQIVGNQRKIDQNCREIRDEWQKFNKELDSWPGIIAQLDKAISDLGNIRSWSLGIQGEVQSLIELLETKEERLNRLLP